MQELFNVIFKQSGIDKFVFYGCGVMIFLYADYGCFLRPSSKSVERAIADLKDDEKFQWNFDLDDPGDISD